MNGTLHDIKRGARGHLALGATRTERARTRVVGTVSRDRRRALAPLKRYVEQVTEVLPRRRRHRTWIDASTGHGIRRQGAERCQHHLVLPARAVSGARGYWRLHLRRGNPVAGRRYRLAGGIASIELRSLLGIQLAFGPGGEGDGGATETSPAPSDQDGDGIADAADRCPSVAAPEFIDGCPRVEPPPPPPSRHSDDDALTTGVLSIPSGVLFASDSAELSDAAAPLLDEIALLLNARTDVRLLEVGGHTDERATDAHNAGLSTRRAAAVRDWLVLRGISRDRLVTKGYGARCPADPAHTEAAWARNRRVELRVLRTANGKTTPEPACAGADTAP